MFVRQFAEGLEIDQILLVRERELRSSRERGEFLRLVLGDRTGTVPAVVREDCAELLGLCEAGACVHVTGRYELHPRPGGPIAVPGPASAGPGGGGPVDLPH